MPEESTPQEKSGRQPVFYVFKAGASILGGLVAAAEFSVSMKTLPTVAIAALGALTTWKGHELLTDSPEIR